ncbi:MAG: hypothetical protein ACD_46C00529G0004 [uncultured bacterium]|nr:MAG: hypothetical protein ACD_46C00529G0004 [uncultured bacterium]
MFSFLKRIFLGEPIDPFNPKSRENIALITLFAWVGLGADPLSSSCYGPAEAYLALGQHSNLALFVAVITIITIFIISIGYNQVIELFPAGGGGYKVATKLLHPYAGLISGSALIVDYVLTIAVSIASGTDAIFSFLPLWMLPYKIYVEAITIIVLLSLNLRGMREAIQILLPIFLGFMLVHIGLIIYGIYAHAEGFVRVVPATMHETYQLSQSVGWFMVIGLILHAYSLGSGTYTGLESISNNVQRLAEPRVRTGKRTTWFMATSLSFVAGGLILLYLLWSVQPVPGETLNATVFHSILGDGWFGQSLLIFTLELEAGLLFVAANAGFLGGPSVLGNMAIDNWVPNRFRHFSSRLVVQNGLIFFGFAALIVLFLTSGNVSTLVVLYSINVFITFSLSLLSISVYWIKHRTTSAWKWHFLLSAFACLVTTTILCVTLFYKFTSGGWLTLMITSLIVILCLFIRRHYDFVAKKLEGLDKLLVQPLGVEASTPYAIDPNQSTAIIYINNYSVGMHTLLSVLRIFPGQFKNFVFVGAGVVDSESYRGEVELEQMQSKVNDMLDYFVKYCSQYQIPAEAHAAFGTDTVQELESISDMVSERYPNGIFFASKLIFSRDSIFTRFLHNQTPNILQHYLHFKGKELMILPMKL